METDWITVCAGISFQTFAICIAYFDLPLSGGSYLPFQHSSAQADIRSANASPNASSPAEHWAQAPCPAPCQLGRGPGTAAPGLAQGRAERIAPGASSGNGSCPAFGPGPVSPAEQSSLLRRESALACPLPVS